MSRVWLITDCAGGLGRELAEVVLEAGDCVVAGTSAPDELADLVAAHGARVLPVVLAATDEASVYAALGAALRTFGRLDVVVNHCAGNADDANARLPEHDLRLAFASRFFGAVSVAHAALALMQEQGAGRIVLLVPSASSSAAASPPAHRAAHAALREYSEALAAEALPSGIRVSCVETGGVDACIRMILENRELATPDAANMEFCLRSGGARRATVSNQRAASTDVLPFPPRPVAA